MPQQALLRQLLCCTNKFNVDEQLLEEEARDAKQETSPAAFAPQQETRCEEADPIMFSNPLKSYNPSPNSSEASDSPNQSPNRPLLRSMAEWMNVAFQAGASHMLVLNDCAL